jgi:hypothetical protein
MPQTAILSPFLAMMALTFVVWVYMYVRRIAFIRRSGVIPQQLAVPGELARITPAAVSNPSDNFKNLFEIPVLFYALALYLFATGQVDGFYVGAAWSFVVLRALHSAVHCTFNLVLLRFWLYAMATAAVWVMLFRAALRHFGGG